MMYVTKIFSKLHNFCFSGLKFENPETVNLRLEPGIWWVETGQMSWRLALELSYNLHIVGLQRCCGGYVTFIYF